MAKDSKKAISIDDVKDPLFLSLQSFSDTPSERAITQVIKRLEEVTAPFNQLSKRLQEINKTGPLQFVEEAQKQYEQIIQTAQRRVDTNYEAMRAELTPSKDGHLSQESIAQIAEMTANELQKRLAHSHAIREFILTASGDLYQKDNPDLCYPLHEKGDRLTLLRALTDQATFIPSELLATQTNYKNSDTVTKAVAGINYSARHNFKLPKDKKYDLIISKRYSGYRINPMYCIAQE